MENNGVFVIGIVDSGFNNEMIKHFKEQLMNYKIGLISLSSYYINNNKINEKQGKIIEEIEEFNFLIPKNINFDKLKNDLVDLKNKKKISIPIFDSDKRIFKDEKEEIENCQIIILEGLLCFYDIRVNKLMDLKLYIDSGNDIRLENLILKGVESGKKIDDIINYFDKNIKLNFNKYISPTKQQVDFFLSDKGYKRALEIIIDYLKKILDGHNLFSYNNKIIEPDAQFYESNLLVINDKNSENSKFQLEYLENVFQDFISNSQDEEFYEEIREKLIVMIDTILSDYLNRNNLVGLTLDRIIFASDDIEKINFESQSNLKYVLYYKTSILNEDDLKIPSYILSHNKDCNIIICSMILSKKALKILLGEKFNMLLLFVTLYFSDIFTRYKDLIEKDETIFNEEELKKLFKKLVNN